MEDDDGESKVPAQDLLVDDVGGHGEEHSDRGKEPGKPAFGEGFGVRVLDFEG